MAKITSRLKKESKTENFRYQLYTDYRKNYRTGENTRVKVIQKQLNKWKRTVEKELKTKNIG